MVSREAGAETATVFARASLGSERACAAVEIDDYTYRVEFEVADLRPGYDDEYLIVGEVSYDGGLSWHDVASTSYAAPPIGLDDVAHGPTLGFSFAYARGSRLIRCRLRPLKAEAAQINASVSRTIVTGAQPLPPELRHHSIAKVESDISNGGTTLNVSFSPTTPADGDLIVVGCAWYLGSFTSFSDNQSNTYSTVNNPAGATQMGYVANANYTSGTWTVTVSGSSGTMTMWISAWSGAAISSVLDGSGANTSGTGTQVTTTAMTPSEDGALIIGLVAHGNYTFTSLTPDDGVTTVHEADSNANHQPLWGWHYVQPTAASKSLSGDFSSSVSWHTHTAVFKPAAGGGPTLVTVTGSKPAGAGVLAVAASIGVTGSKPAGSGTIGFAASIATAGSHPAGSGTLATAATITLAGSHPAGSGVVAAAQAQQVTGSHPAGSGTLAITATIGVTGSHPGGTGSLQLAATIALTGAHPAGSGVIAAEFAGITLTGSHPAGSGTLAIAATIALTGSHPAGSGALQIAATIALAGSHPAGTGVVVAASVTFIAITGSHPAGSGTLNITQAAFVTGSHPAGSGVLALVAVIGVFGSSVPGGGQPGAGVASGASTPGPGVLALIAVIAITGSHPAGSGVISATASAQVTGSHPAGSGVVVGTITAVAVSLVVATGCVGLADLLNPRTWLDAAVPSGYIRDPDDPPVASGYIREPDDPPAASGFIPGAP